MRTINKFYKLHFKDSPLENDFDIKELDEMTFRFNSPSVWDDLGRSLFDGERVMTHTKLEDYDVEFYKRILRLKPVYILSEFLDYHYESFCSINEDKELFLKHIQYVILPRLKNIKRSEIFEIANEWLNKCRNKILKEQENDTVNFLYRAYEEAQRAFPMSPFSARINPYVLGDLLNFDNAKVKRIVTELNSEYYVDTTAGFADMIINPKGYAYLKNYYNNVNTKQENSINIINSNGSNILIQKDNTNSVQNLQINDLKIEDLKNLAYEIDNKFEELSKQISNEASNELRTEIEYLKNNLNKENPKQDKLKNVFNEIKNILVAVPVNVIANILSQPLINLLFNS
jgi:hypothetical protein